MTPSPQPVDCVSDRREARFATDFLGSKATSVNKPGTVCLPRPAAHSPPPPLRRFKEEKARKTARQPVGSAVRPIRAAAYISFVQPHTFSVRASCSGVHFLRAAAYIFPRPRGPDLASGCGVPGNQPLRQTYTLTRVTLTTHKPPGLLPACRVCLRFATGPWDTGRPDGSDSDIGSFPWHFGG